MCNRRGTTISLCDAMSRRNDVLMSKTQDDDSPELGGTDYRMLEVGEPFGWDDQILDTFSGEWKGTNRVGQTVPDDGHWYRRRIV